MIDDRILEKLNERQREAVFETEGYVRVIAGAGSGKTKLLVSRYAYLVQEYGIDSANILCVTFTNKAAGEMKKRIRGLIGDGYDTNLICTYHGFCNRVLRENPEKVFLNKQFQIIDSYQQKAILSEIYRKYELKLDYASFESTLKQLALFKAKNDYVPAMCNPNSCRILPNISSQSEEILEEFMQRQKATFSLDFQDLIYFAIHVLMKNEDVREMWQERLNYIMVDEFQDSSKTEMRLIDILSNKYKNLMIVGDPDQNIYEWRGSDVRLLVDFEKNHNPTKNIILNQSYRSTPEILRCANTLIEKNKLRLKKDLFTEKPGGTVVTHYHSMNDFEEMDHVIENINRIRRMEDLKYSDFAILYRTSFLSRIAEKKLVERNVPYEIVGGVKFYQRMEILDILAYLKLIAFDDDISFKRIINTPRRRFGRSKQTLLESIKEGRKRENEQLSIEDFPVREDAEEYIGRSLFDTLKANLDHKEIANSDVGPFVHFIESIRKRLGTMHISEIVREVTEKTGYEKYIRELGDEERLDNLAEFKRLSGEFERDFGEDLSLEEFLQQIALQSDEKTDGEQDTVKMMTIHAAKGLEFPVVFILGLTEGIFPSSKTIEERKEEGLEEERRLCYVAITRAERHLFLMDSEGVSPKGIKKLYSRFLNEIGEENYRRIGKISDELHEESRNYTRRLNREMQLDESNHSSYGVGTIVEHHIFGKGVIQHVDEKRGSYLVAFDSLPQPRNISKAYFSESHRNPKDNIRERFATPARMNELSVNKQEESQGESVFDEGDQVPTITDNEKCIRPEEPLEFEVEIDDGGECKEEMVELETEDVRDEYSETVEYAESLIVEESFEQGSSDSELEKAIQQAKERAKTSSNLWKHEDVPHSGWHCVDVEDLGAPVGICEMCGYQIIRYAHYMEHPEYGGLVCGCICAGRMEGDIEGAKRRENELKNRLARRVSFFKRKWKVSANGNDYLKLDDHLVVICRALSRGMWKFAIDNVFSEKAYETKERAKAAAFDQLERIRESGIDLMLRKNF